MTKRRGGDEEGTNGRTVGEEFGKTDRETVSETDNKE